MERFTKMGVAWKKNVIRVLCALLLALVLIGPDVAQAGSVTIAQGATKTYSAVANGETINVSLTSAYTSVVCQGKPGWITSSKNGSKFTLTVSKNTGSSSRTGDVVFRDGSKLWTLRVTQSAAAAKTITVKFDSNGGYGNVPSRTYTVGSKYNTLPAGSTPQTGYVFDGWYTAKSGGTKITVSSTVSSSYTTLYAHYVPKQFTVSFYTDGGSYVSSKKVAYKSTYGTLTTPTKSGYNFDGWYTSLSGGTKVTATTTMNTAADHTLYARWTSANCTITFDVNGGNGQANMTSLTVKQGATIGSTLDNRKPGPPANKHFVGWFTSAYGGTQYKGTSKAPNSPTLKLYAHYEQNKYDIVFNKNAYSASGAMAKMTCNVGSYYSLTSNTFTQRGYTFDGWNTKADGSGTSYRDGQMIHDLSTKDGDTVTLYAQWKVAYCTITFDVNGGYGQSSLTSLSVQQGSTIGSTLDKRTPGAPAGKHFVGWFDAATGGTQYRSTSKAPYSSTLKLYAHWDQNSYTVVFNQNATGVTGTMKNETYVVGSSYHLPGNAFGRDGYAFDGWNTKADGSGTQYANTALVSDLTKVDGATVTLYAQWKILYCTISFDVNGGSGQSNLTALNVQQGATIGNSLDTRTPGAPAHMHFVGWFTEKTGGKEYKSNSKAPYTSTLKLYARWEQDYYTIVFNQNATGVTGTMENKTCYVGSSFYLPTSPFGLTGFVFDGWNTKSNGSGKSYADGAKIVEDLSTTNAATVTLYAQWKPDYCKIIFDVNGGYGNIPAESIQKGKTIGSIMDREPGAPQYMHFVGWYTAKTGGTRYTSSSTAPFADTLRLYARWEKDTYTIVFNQNATGVTGTMTNMTCEAGTSYDLPTCPFRLQGSIFNGWNTKADGSGIAYKDGTSIINLATKHGSTVVLYAQWHSDKVVVSFDVNGGDAHYYQPITVHYGEKYGTLPEAPTRKGYFFIGWYTEPKDGIQIVSDSRVTNKENHVLYAQWYRNEYTVDYEFTTFDTQKEKHMVKRNDYTIAFSDFTKSSYLYQQSLIKASLQTAMAAFDAKEVNSSYNRDRNIKQLMKDLEFNSFYSHYETPTYDSIGYAIAKREIRDPATMEESTLILIAIRGAGYVDEWGGNFRVYDPNGENLNHYGFELAANKVLAGLNYYMEQTMGDYKGKVKIWVVGYSRAAATTNLVCSKIIRESYPLPMSIDSKDVFGFGYETPRCTTDMTCHDSKYNGIKSVINPVDFVPMVAMRNNKGWMYERYGMTFCIPDDPDTKAFDDMKKVYRDILSYYQRTNELDTRLAGYPSRKEQHEFLCDVFTKLADHTKTPQLYYEKGVQDVLVPAMALIMNLEAEWFEGVGDVMNLLLELADNLEQFRGMSGDEKLLAIAYIASIIGDSDLDQFLFNVQSVIQYSHFPELCLSWVTSYDGRLPEYLGN